MKLVTFKVNTPAGAVQRIGALLNETKIVDLNLGYADYLREAGEETKIYEAANLRLPPDMIEYFKGGEPSKQAAKQTIDYVSQQLKKGDVLGPKGEQIVWERQDVKLMAPVPKPASIRTSTVYAGHFRVGPPRSENWYKYPSASHRNTTNVIGTDEPIVRPHYAKYFDCELEVGFYVGQECRDVIVEEAEKYIAGYTIYGDATVRELIFKDNHGDHEKVCNVMGPCLVTPDEIDETNLKVIYRINGEVFYEGNTGINRNFYSPELLAYYSENCTLYPGEFGSCGTVDTACVMEAARWLQPGDVLEFEVEGIGILRNPITQGPPKKVSYVLNGLPGHLEYKGPHVEMKLPWEQ